MTYIRTCGCQWGQDDEGDGVQLVTCVGHLTQENMQVVEEATSPDGRWNGWKFACGCSGAHDLWKDRFQEGDTCPDHLASALADFEPLP